MVVGQLYRAVEGDVADVSDLHSRCKKYAPPKRRQHRLQSRCNNLRTEHNYMQCLHRKLHDDKQNFLYTITVIDMPKI
jgi:hypothetical protein